jgi:D-alanyl-D-alanine carboxypeptidase
MISWSQSLLNGEFLPVATLQKYWQPLVLQSGQPAWHANGWNYSSHDDVTTVGHAGSDRLVWRHTYKTSDPADSATVIYLDNGGRTALRPARLAAVLGELVMAGSAPRTDLLEERLLQRLATANWNDAVARDAQGLTEPKLEAAVNTVGYDALTMLGADAALHAFRWNAARFANSPNAHDSLGEAYRARGDLRLARSSYARALELDSGNARIQATLAEIDAALAAGH